MKPGDTVSIYHDPITKKKLEGKATLVEIIKFWRGNGLIDADVRFEDEPKRIVRRRISLIKEN